MGTAVVVERLSKSFGRTQALSDISCTLRCGESVILVGSNGAGKTTLLQCIAGLLAPDAGTVSFAPVQKDNRYTAAGVGYCGQESFLYGDLTIRENLLLYATLNGCGASAGERVEQLGAEHGLTRQHLDKRVRACSPGVVKRASLARALMGDPTVLLCDEPFSDLDEEGRKRLTVQLQTVSARQGTVLFAAHDPDIIRSHTGRIFRLKDGSLSVEGA